MKKKSNKTCFGLGIALFALSCAVCLLPSGEVLAENEMADPDTTRAALEKWVETRRIISQEKRDLALAKEILNERIELVEHEIQSLRDKITEAEENIAEADKKREDMLEENEKLKQTSAALSGTMVTLETQTRELLTQLPDPIRQRVKPLSQRLPEDAEKTDLSAAERFQNILGILNEVDKFNHEISVTSEVRTLEDGSSVEVTALYIGISQGYYSGANGQIAGIGTATAEGWEWKPANEAAAEIAAAIAILNNEKVASFVQLPVEIH